MTKHNETETPSVEFAAMILNEQANGNWQEIDIDDHLAMLDQMLVEAEARESQMDILTITRGEEVFTISPETVLAVVDHWDAEKIYSQLVFADVGVTFIDDLIAAHNGEWIGVPIHANKTLVTVIYIDVECLNKHELYEGDNSVPYKRLYNQIGVALGTTGLISLWPEYSGGDGFVNFLVNCYVEDIEQVKLIIEAVIANETELKVLCVEVDDEEWPLEPDDPHGPKVPGGDWEAHQPIPEVGGHQSSDLGEAANEEVAELVEAIKLRREQSGK